MTVLTSRGHAAILILAELLVLGCDQKGDTGEPQSLPATGHAASSIGPEGGSLELQEVTLDVPAGALDGEVNIGVDIRQADLEGMEALSAVYEFSPGGLTFEAPVKLTFRLQEADVTAQLYRADDAEANLEQVTDTELVGTVLTADISGFSRYVVARLLRTPEPAQGDSFTVDGHRYSPTPVTGGAIEGFSYSSLGGLDVTDGEQSGHVWYNSYNCLTFRPNGTGVSDARGGTGVTLKSFPFIAVDWKPGTATSSAAPGLDEDEPAGRQILDPNYVRASELEAFQWGVRLNDDGTVYENYSGWIEYYLKPTVDSKFAARTLQWDTEKNKGVDFSTTPGANSHFCYFRERPFIALASPLRCLETKVSNDLTKKHCYAEGMLEGEYSVVTNDGIALESGQFKENRPAEHWGFKARTGKVRADGNFDELGIHRGKWQFYDTNGNLERTATFNGGVQPSFRGYFRALDGSYEEYQSSLDGTSSYLSSEGAYLGGQKNLWWHDFDAVGMTAAHEYDAAVQLSTGQSTCFAAPPAEPTCFALTQSWRKQALFYDWGRCVTGVNKLTEKQFDQDGNITAESCYQLTGTPDKPVRGASTGCGTVCGA